jgi:lysine-specific permease
MNFIILVALISAANASLYSSTRILWYLSKKSGRKNLAQVNRQGVPLKALLVTAFVGSIAFLCSFIGNGKLFYMLVTIASISCFVSWLGIAWSHYKFRKDYLPKVGGLSILKYKARFFPYAQIISIVMLLIIILAQFLTFDSNTDFWDKLSVYFGVIPFIILYIFHKLRTRIKLTKNS